MHALNITAMDPIIRNAIIGLAYYLCFILVFSRYDKALRRKGDSNRKTREIVLLAVHSICLLVIGLFRMDYLDLLSLLAIFSFTMSLMIVNENPKDMDDLNSSKEPKNNVIKESVQ